MAPMSEPPASSTFETIVRQTVADEELQRWLVGYQVVAQQWQRQVHAELGDPESWRDAVADVRRHTIAHLDHYIAQFAGNVERSGGHVFFAATAAEARDYVVELARRKAARRIVKAKSMVVEETGIDAALEADGAQVSATDLGDYIVQLTGEKPYHITGPALHKTMPQIRRIFSEVAGEELPDDAEALAAFARRELRQRFLTAEMGITGANIGVASTGTIVLVTNEGNGRLSSTLPPTHVVVMGMERLVPDWRSLEPLLTMLPRAGTGERVTAYMTAITGPRRDGDVDGPDELHVVIVDNGRSRILGTKYQPVLQCIRCGCCADWCPVYRTMGGHAYESVYTGPIGAVLTPLLYGFAGHEHLPFASTLCGACQSACPARVPLADLLLELRADIVAARRPPVAWRLGFRGFARASEHRRLWDALLAAARSLAPLAALGRSRRVARRLPHVVRAWTDSRELPLPAPLSFGRLWARGPGGPPRPIADGAGTRRPSTATGPATATAHASRPAAAAAPATQRADGSQRAGLEHDDPQLAGPGSAELDLADREPLDRDALVRLFSERLGELGGAAALVATRAAAQAAIAERLRAHGTTTVACAPSLRWPGIDALWTADARTADYGLSEAEWGIAETGTVVLRHLGEHGRSSSLVPPAAGFLLPVSRLVPRLGPVVQAVHRESTAHELPACLTFISGPSHSGDIAGILVAGVHGPGDVSVWLIADE